MTMVQIGEFDAYVAHPPQTPKAAIIVIKDILGVNAGIRQKCDRLAATGVRLADNRPSGLFAEHLA